MGAYAPFVQSDVGVMAVQGWVNPAFGLLGMDMLERGMTARDVLEQLLFQDPGREFRQMAAIDRAGNGAAHTGTNNDEAKGHVLGDAFCVLGNCLAKETVLTAMAEAFIQTKGSLAERLLAALIAGDLEGGDRRGKQSAAVRVEALVGFPFVDFRVDHHPDPVFELNRIYMENKWILIDRYDEWVESVRNGVPFRVVSAPFTRSTSRPVRSVDRDGPSRRLPERGVEIAARQPEQTGEPQRSFHSGGRNQV